MKFLPRVACLLLAAFPLAPFPASAQSQHEMNAGAAADFAKADKELNEVYAKVLGVLDDGSKEKLKKSQRAWVAYRDAEAQGVKLEMEWLSARDGSVRDTHRALDGQRVPVDGRFKATDGDTARYPGDFANVANDANCRCAVVARVS